MNRLSKVWNMHIVYLVYQLSEKLIFLRQLDFDIVDFITIYSAEVALEDIEEIKKWAEYEGWPIDGVVAKYNNIDIYKKQGMTSHHFNGGLAFKFYDETYQTALRSIEWTMGRTGQLTPIAIFDPVEIDGTIVERCSLSNISVLKSKLNHPFKGQEILITKSNMIIPYLVDAKDENNNWISKNFS